jgi:hypothetical protein
MSEWQDAKQYVKDLLDEYYFIESYDGLGVLDRELTDSDRIEAMTILVDEVLDALSLNYWQNKMTIEFYEEVKKEINKL